MGDDNPPLPIKPLTFDHYISMLKQFRDKFKEVVKPTTETEDKNV